MVALSCAIDALRAANLETGTALFGWTLIAENAELVQSSSGIGLQCISVDECVPADTPIDVIVVCGGEHSHSFSSPKVDRWLKAWARHNIMIGAISDGAFVVAACGLFDRHRSTIHWKCQSAYRERYPDLDIRTSIIEIDGNRFSCAGGTSSLDLFLLFITRTFDARIAGKVADNYFHDFIRGADQTQPLSSGLRHAARSEKLSFALVLMASEIEYPLEIGEIAEKTGVSLRQLDRLFNKYLSVSPSRHYRNIRLLQAAGLLRQTGLPVSKIALGCGFQSSSHLSKFFRKKYNATPNQYRRSCQDQDSKYS